MYGGNDKSLKEIIAEVKKTVIGQADAIEWLCSFVGTACDRSRIIREQGLDSLSLPNFGSALLVGPTASGKSHLLKTFAKTAGLLFHPIDANQMSAEGYRGNNFSIEWMQVGAKLEENPDLNVLVFIDEIDKLYAQRRESVGRDGWAGFDLLKPLEGGVLSGASPKGEPWSLDCDRCIFVLAGAFTGIEQMVSQRLAAKAPSVGFSPIDASPHPSFSENELRERISFDDIEEWGAPREIVGRFSTIKFIKPLGEDALRSIVRGRKQSEYSAMLGGDAKFSIDADAEDILVKKALAENYGARSINRQLNMLFCGPIWRSVSDAGSVASVTLTGRDGELDFRIEAGSEDVASPSLVAEADRLSSKSAYALLREVHRYVKESDGASEFNPHDTLGADCTAYAAALLLQSGDAMARKTAARFRNDFSLAEVTLLYALYSLLQDWFRASDFTPASLRLLLKLADITGTKLRSGLDLMFYDLESGKSYVRNSNHNPNNPSSREWHWVDTRFRRNGDGLLPARKGGLEPGEDSALDYYTEFKGYPKESQQKAIGSLAFRLL